MPTKTLRARVTYVCQDSRMIVEPEPFYASADPVVTFWRGRARINGSTQLVYGTGFNGQPPQHWRTKALWDGPIE